MTTIKLYTDIKQSRKLAEILPHDSADMLWEQHGAEHYVTIKPYTTVGKSIGCHCLRCWSLAALLSVLPILERKGYQKAKPRLSYNVIINKWIVDSHVYTTDAYDNPVDACYEMILKLNELKKL